MESGQPLDRRDRRGRAWLLRRGQRVDDLRQVHGGPPAGRVDAVDLLLTEVLDAARRGCAQDLQEMSRILARDIGERRQSIDAGGLGDFGEVELQPRLPAGDLPSQRGRQLQVEVLAEDYRVDLDVPAA